MQEPYLGTKPLRYEKYSAIKVNGIPYTLIEYLSYKRKEKKLSKKYISQIIRGNDYWYSQIEMGKNDDHRRKFINRTDLTDIISVIIFDAKNNYELKLLKIDSENYIDTILKPISYDSEPRAKQLYEVINTLDKIMAPDYMNKRLDDTLFQLNETLRTIFSSSDPMLKDSIITLINLMILNLSIDPIISLHYYGLPFSPIFSSKFISENNSDTNIEQELLQDLDKLLEKYSKILPNSDFIFILNKLAENIVNCANAIGNPFSQGIGFSNLET